MKKQRNWQSLSIEELTGERLGMLEASDSFLVSSCKRYAKVPVKLLTTEQLRVLIGQAMGIEYLVPVALITLENDILAEGDYYPGDLLESVAKVDKVFWKYHPELFEAFNALLAKNVDLIKNEGLNVNG